ncbi:MAG TPA: hypothetical protein VKU00_26305 [Chthonomonadaceae bacterium]|nr:hypothetical protein [Chthonomonadaceae bacterium]
MPYLSLPLIALLLLTGVVAMAAPHDAYPDADHLPVISELPDPFLLPNGKRVKSAKEWEAHRKALLETILHYEYGPLPPVLDHVVGTETASRQIEATHATEREILLTMGPEDAIKTHLILTLPAGKGPFPIILRGDLCWGRLDPAIVAEVVRRGYALAEFDRTEIAPDSKERGGVYAAYPDYQGGRLSAWAWGYHRVTDYLWKQPFVDRRHIVVTGHSRGGKATLLAGATDPRIALTAPNNSGCGGAGCFRYQADKSEDIAAILKSFPFWFEPHFGDFIGKVDRLPFDQHTLKALIAPRALLSTEGLEDLWANPKGTQQTWAAAREVYAFLGANERIGIRFRPGGHEHGMADWTALLDFADQQFFHKSSTGPFDQPAFPDLPKAYAWGNPDKGGTPSRK